MVGKAMRGPGGRLRGLSPNSIRVRISVAGGPLAGLPRGAGSAECPAPPMFGAGSRREETADLRLPRNAPARSGSRRYTDPAGPAAFRAAVPRRALARLRL